MRRRGAGEDQPRARRRPDAADGNHEVVTVLQRLDLCDTIELEPSDELRVEGFADDTLVRRALEAVAAAAGVEPRWAVRIEKRIPVAAGLGGGSSDAATALRLANETLDEPLPAGAAARDRAHAGRRRPVLPRAGPQLGTGDGSTLEPLDLPQDYACPARASTRRREGVDRRGLRPLRRRRRLRGARRQRARARTDRRESARSRRSPRKRPRVLAARRRAHRPRSVSRRRERSRPGRLRPLRRPRSRRARSGGNSAARGAFGSPAPRGTFDVMASSPNIVEHGVSRSGRLPAGAPDSHLALDSCRRGRPGRGRRAAAHRSSMCWRWSRSRFWAIGGRRLQVGRRTAGGLDLCRHRRRWSRSSRSSSASRRSIAEFAIVVDRGRGADLPLHRPQPHVDTRTYTRRAVGRSQAVRQRVLVPRSQVRILAPQPSWTVTLEPDMSETPLAAVVMAAGLGTRMRSAVPKHLHALLGRRMVDWVIVAAEPSRAPIRSSSSRRLREGRVRRARGRGPGAAARHRRCRSRGPRGARRSSRATCSCSPATPCCSRRAARAICSRRHRARGAAATVLAIEADDAADYGRLVRNADGDLERIVEARDATPEELALTEINSSIYVFRSDKLWPVLEQLEPHNAQGELYLTDTIGLLVAAGEKVAIHVSPEPFEVGVNTRVELAAAAAVLRDRINRGAHARGRDDRRSGNDVDRAGRRDRARRDDSPVRDALRAHDDRNRRGDPVAHRGRRRRGRPRSDRRPILLPSSWHCPRSGFEGGYLRGDQELTHRDAAQRCRTSRTSATPRSARTRTSAPARSLRTSPTAPASPKGRTKIGKNVRTGIQNGFVAPVEVGDGAWTAAGTMVTKDVPPDALAIARTRQENKEGYAARQRDD